MCPFPPSVDCIPLRGLNVVFFFFFFSFLGGVASTSTCRQQTVTDDERAGCEVTRLGFAHETQRYPALAATVTAGRLPAIRYPFARHPCPKPTTKAHHNISSTVGSARLGALPPTLASPNNQYFFTTQTNLNFSSARGYIATI